jgi:hypothetical protein
MNKNIISYEEWRRQLDERGNTANSGAWIPICEKTAYEYKCNSNDFLNEPKYSVLFTNNDCTTIVHWDACNAKPISIQDFVKNPYLVDSFLLDWEKKLPSDIRFNLLNDARVRQ